MDSSDITVGSGYDGTLLWLVYWLCQRSVTLLNLISTRIRKISRVLSETNEGASRDSIEACERDIFRNLRVKDW